MRHSKGCNNSPQGFSLLEALIAVGLLAATTVVFLSVWLAQGLNISLGRLTLAGQIASREIEKMRAKPFPEIIATTTPLADPALADLPRGAGTTTVSNYFSTSTIKQIEVLITWQERGGQKRYLLHTLVTEGTTNP